MEQNIYSGNCAKNKMDAFLYDESKYTHIYGNGAQLTLSLFVSDGVSRIPETLSIRESGRTWKPICPIVSVNSKLFAS